MVVEFDEATAPSLVVVVPECCQRCVRLIDDANKGDQGEHADLFSLETADVL